MAWPNRERRGMVSPGYPLVSGIMISKETVEFVTGALAGP